MTAAPCPYRGEVERLRAVITQAVRDLDYAEHSRYPTMWRICALRDLRDALPAYTIRQSDTPPDVGMWHVYDAAGEFVNSFGTKADAAAHVREWTNPGGDTAASTIGAETSGPRPRQRAEDHATPDRPGGSE